jgi:hypothetical protein
MQFQWNFTGLICSSSPCAYCTGFLVDWFLAELWPFDKKVFFSVCCQIRKSLSRLLLINYRCNFIQTLQEWSVPSIVVHCPVCLSVCLSVCHKICPNMKLAIMRRHMWLLIALVLFLSFSGEIFMFLNLQTISFQKM